MNRYFGIFLRFKNSFVAQAAIVLISISLLTGCTEINTTDPIKAYKYWSGMKPSSDIEVLNGQYWESAHWSKEYILYLKLKPTDEWWNQFLKDNHLVLDNDVWIKPSKAPDWFQPSNDYIKYRRNSDFDQGSRCFYDSKSGECYIYDIQL